MNATIRVTQAHIDKGTPRSGDSCPVALAIDEATGLGIRVSGGLSDCLSKSGQRKVRKFTFNFDRGLPVEPFGFKLRITRRNGFVEMLPWGTA